MEQMLHALIALIMVGFTIGVVVAVIVAAIRAGWVLMPWILITAFIVWASQFFG